MLIDWSQNSRHKTTVCAYSLRARPHPTVSTPVTWDEVEAAADGDELSFEADEVLERIDDLGDLFAETATLEQTLPAKLICPTEVAPLGHPLGERRAVSQSVSPERRPSDQDGSSARETSDRPAMLAGVSATRADRRGGGYGGAAA